MNCIQCGRELTGKQKKYCSRTCQNKISNTRNQNYEAQQKRGRERKAKLIEKMGGGCSRCGYNKCHAALSFHHLRDKSFQLSIRELSNHSMERITEEAAKCVLLCANCHMEKHHRVVGRAGLEPATPKL